MSVFSVSSFVFCLELLGVLRLQGLDLFRVLRLELLLQFALGGFHVALGCLLGLLLGFPTSLQDPPWVAAVVVVPALLRALLADAHRGQVGRRKRREHLEPVLTKHQPSPRWVGWLRLF